MQFPSKELLTQVIKHTFELILDRKYKNDFHLLLFIYEPAKKTMARSQGRARKKLMMRPLVRKT
jgi:hypothetical protein